MSSFRRRPARRDDLAAVTALVAAFDVAVLGRSEWSDEIEQEWRELDVERDAWIVELGGRVAGYGTVELEGGLGKVDAYVLPEAWGVGIGAELARGLEGELRHRGAARVQNGVLAGDGAAQRLLRGLGYAEIRRFWQMRIELDRPPTPPTWPEGLAPARPEADDLPALHAAVEEAFADHWNHAPEPHDRFLRRYVELDEFDPTLWRIVRDGSGSIVAGTICRPERLGVGWIARLFTRRAWRGRGVGAALLADAFSTFWARGRRRIGLGVDAQSETGAHRLYERAGMRVDWSAVVFEKALA